MTKEDLPRSPEESPEERSEDPVPVADGEESPRDGDRRRGGSGEPDEIDLDLREMLASHDLTTTVARDAKLALGGADEMPPPDGGDAATLLARLDRVEDTQAEILTHLAQSHEGIEQLRKALMGEIGRLRQDLLDDQRALATGTVFHAVIPWLNSLRTMHEQVPARQRVARGHLAAIIEILRAMLQGLGFQEFHVETGEPFDPTRMECVGYGQGAPGVVLKLERPGYHAGAVLMQRAGVRIGAPPEAGSSH